MLRRIQKILPVALNHELVELGKAQNVMRRWDEIVGPVLGQRSAPDRFDRGILWVAVQGSAWAQELRLMKLKILPKLNELSGEKDLFKDIRFGVRKLPIAEIEASVEPETTLLSEKPSIQEIRNRRLKIWKDVGSV